MADPSDPLGHDPLQDVERDSLWSFPPAPQAAPAADRPAPPAAAPPPPGAAPSPAPAPATTPAKPQGHHLVTFTVCDEFYGIDIKSIQEIIRYQEVCFVPNAPPYMEGLINVRGRIMPVINLRKRLGMPAESDGDGRYRRVIIISVKGSVMGLIVDAVREVMHVPTGVIEPPNMLTAGEGVDYVQGVAKLEDHRLLIILILDKLLAHLH